MKPPDNITGFAAAAGLVLGELHGAFPRPVEIHAGTLQEELVAGRGWSAECAWAEGESNLVSCTLDWLVAEGFVRCEVFSPPLYGRLVLTAKGFAALERPVELPGAKARLPVGRWLREAGRLAGECALKAVVAQAVRNLPT